MRDVNNDQFGNDNSRAKFKQRIAGGAVLVIVLAIFLPFIFSHSHVAPEAAQTAPTAAANVAPAEAAGAQPEAAAPAETAATAQPEAAAPAAAAPPAATHSVAAPSTTAVMALTSPDQNNPQTDKSMSSDQPGLTPSQSEAAPPTAPAPAPAPAPSAAAKQKPAHHARVVVHKNLASVDGRWVVQVGSFSQADYAKHLASKLRAHGLQAYTQRENNLVHVYVGPIASTQQAQKVQKQCRPNFN